MAVTVPGALVAVAGQVVTSDATFNRESGAATGCRVALLAASGGFVSFSVPNDIYELNAERWAVGRSLAVMLAIEMRTWDERSYLSTKYVRDIHPGDLDAFHSVMVNSTEEPARK